MSHTTLQKKTPSLTFYVKIDFYFSKKVHIERWKQSLHFQVEDSKESNHWCSCSSIKTLLYHAKRQILKQCQQQQKKTQLYLQASVKKTKQNGNKNHNVQKNGNKLCLDGQNNEVSRCMKKYHTTKVWAVTLIGTKTLYNIYRPAFCSFSPNTLGLPCIFWHSQKHYKRTLQNKMPGQSINIYVYIYV